MAEDRRQVMAAALLALLLTVLACNFPGAGTPTPTDADSGDTPTPTSTPTPACAPDAPFVSDLTVPDGTMFPPSVLFVKTWQVENSGTCAWEPGTVLAFASGDQMGAAVSVNAGVVAAGATADLSVGLTAPVAAGTYEGQWRLEGPGGSPFGTALFVRIVVADPTVTPTPACVAPDGVFVDVLTYAQDAGQNPGCSIGPAITVNGVFQLFETNAAGVNPPARMGGFMLWRADEGLISALGNGWASYMPAHDGDVLHVYNDLWDEGQPETHPDCASMAVPSGYQLPRRGFGKVWCENGLWDDTKLGWPGAAEAGATLLIQPTRNGVLIGVTGYPGGNPWYFTLDIPGGRWYGSSPAP